MYSTYSFEDKLGGGTISSIHDIDTSNFAVSRQGFRDSEKRYKCLLVLLLKDLLQCV